MRRARCEPSLISASALGRLRERASSVRLLPVSGVADDAVPAVEQDAGSEASVAD
jgi:hypothetical protein